MAKRSTPAPAQPAAPVAGRQIGGNMDVYITSEVHPRRNPRNGKEFTTTGYSADGVSTTLVVAADTEIALGWNHVTGVIDVRENENVETGTRFFTRFIQVAEAAKCEKAPKTVFVERQGAIRQFDPSKRFKPAADGSAN